MSQGAGLSRTDVSAPKEASSQTARRLAFVLPRYARNIGGGAETLAGEIARRLAALPPEESHFDEIEIWTTCAQDHRTWENFHPPGITHEDNLTIYRFPVDERDLEVFISAEIAVRDGRSLTLDEQLGWLTHSVNSRRLYQHIAERGKECAAILFAPYLFATSFWGAMIHPERAVLIPCLHDEPYAYFPVFNALFRSVRGFIFNAYPELELAKGLYDVEDFEQKSAVVGMGFVPPAMEQSQEATFTKNTPYLLYSGRKETGKNLDLLLDWFSSYKRQYPTSNLELRLIGAGSIDFLEVLPEGVSDLGFVSEAEKQDLMRNALALCQPSVNESFSIVLMEAWLAGTPVLVHDNCAVTKDHVLRSGGGLLSANSLEFSACMQFLLERPAEVQAMGEAGRRYVLEQYNWKAVLKRFTDALEQFGLLPEKINQTHEIAG